MSATNVFRQAIKELGGQKPTSELVGCAQSTISSYATGGNPPADVCIRIEVATGGKFRADKMRPDLADVFAEFRAPKRRKAV